MSSFSCNLEGRTFQALLNGLCKRLFYEDVSITIDYLYEQLYNGIDITDAEAKAQVLSYEEVDKNIMNSHVHTLQNKYF